MHKVFIWILLIFVWLTGFMTAKVFADDHVYTNDDIRRMMYGPGTAPAAKVPQGMHPVTRFTVPASYGKPQFEVESWIGDEKHGYYEVNSDGSINKSHWKQSLKES